MFDRKKKYYCKCGEEIHYYTFLYGQGECKSCSKSGNKNGRFTKGETLKQYFCECGKEISLNSAIYGSKQCRKCADKEYDKIGENNPNWKGGKTKIETSIWNNSKNKFCRFEVFKRDNYTCQLCKKSKSGHINSHHKIPVSVIIELYNIKTLRQALNCNLLWDINWQITLCTKCHSKITKG